MIVAPMKMAGSRQGPLLRAMVLAAILAGCTGLPPAQVENPNTHVLVAKPIGKAVRSHRELVMEVSAPRAWPGFDTLQMAYVQRPYALDYFATSRWADTPARMVGPLLAQALEQTGSFLAIVQAPNTVPADLRLNTDLIHLQHNFMTRPSHVDFALRVQLIDIPRKRVIASKLFEETEPAPSDDAYGGVAAANSALQRLLEQIAEFCVVESGRR